MADRDMAIRVWHKHLDPFDRNAAPSSAVIDAMLEFAALAAPAAQPVAWVNNCDKSACAALRYLAAHQRPEGGQARYNAEHLLQIAAELEHSVRTIAAPAAQPVAKRGPLSDEEVEERRLEWINRTPGVLPYAFVAGWRAAERAHGITEGGANG